MNVITRKKSNYRYWRERYRLENERKKIGNEEEKKEKKKYYYNNYKNRYYKHKTSNKTKKWLKDYDNLYKSKFPDMADYDHEMELRMNRYY